MVSSLSATALLFFHSSSPLFYLPPLQSSVREAFQSQEFLNTGQLISSLTSFSPLTDGILSDRSSSPTTWYQSDLSKLP